MTAENECPAYGRLTMKFTAIGPYFRQQESSESSYFFDCLSSCISAKKEPDVREFWGWCFTLTPTKKGFEYRYYFGRYDAQGKWHRDKVPAKHSEAVLHTLNDFYIKLVSVIEEEFELTLTEAKDLDEVALSAAAA